jgi:hypothetical protein
LGGRFGLFAWLAQYFWHLFALFLGAPGKGYFGSKISLPRRAWEGRLGGKFGLFAWLAQYFWHMRAISRGRRSTFGTCEPFVVAGAAFSNIIFNKNQEMLQKLRVTHRLMVIVARQLPEVRWLSHWTSDWHEPHGGVPREVPEGV